MIFEGLEPVDCTDRGGTCTDEEPDRGKTPRFVGIVDVAACVGIEGPFAEETRD